MSLEQDITDAITPVIDTQGFRLWDVKVSKASKNPLVSISVDRLGGATLNDVTTISKAIAPILDEHPRLAGAYNLEVATPGSERTLNKPEHYTYCLGEQIAVSYRNDTLVRRKGKLVSTSDSDITIETSEKDEIRNYIIPFESITKAHTIFDFEEAMKKDRVQQEPLTQPEGEIA